MTSTELGYLSGVTSNIQDQLNGKVSNTVSTSSASSTYHYAYITKIGTFVSCTLLPKALGSGTQYSLTLTIPSGYRPASPKTFKFFSDTAKWAGDDTGSVAISVNTNGTLSIGAAYGFSITETSRTIFWST